MRKDRWRMNADRSFALHAEIHSDWEVIGCDECLAAAMHPNLHRLHALIKIDVIEVDQWKKTRIGPGPSEERTDGSTFKMMFKQARSESRNPFIEIP